MNYFYFAAETWLDVRVGKVNAKKFVHNPLDKEADMLARTLFFDFHSLMNDEISYLFFPTYLDTKKEFFELGIEELKELDDLATLMFEPDKNFDELRYLFENDKKFRVLNTPLLGDKGHLEI